MRGSALTLLVACGGSIGVVPDAAVRDAAVVDTNPTFEDATPSKPRVGPRELIFHNQENDPLLASGIAVVRRATDESDITDYVLYWGSGLQPMGGALAVLPVTGKDVAFEIDDFTKRPAGATDLLAYSRNAYGETGIAPARLAFMPPKYVEVSSSGHSNPRAVFEPISRRVIVQTNAAPFRWFMCKADGTDCTNAVVMPKSSSNLFAITVDDKGKRIFTAWIGGGITGCLFAGGTCIAEPGGSWSTQPDIAFDPINGRVLATHRYNSQTILFGISANMTGYFTKDLGSYGSSGSPLLTVDVKNQKLVVVMDGPSLRMLRCGLDGSNCDLKDVFAGTPYMLRPPLMTDGDRLLAVSDEFDGMNRSLRLYSMGLDGSAPAHTPVLGQYSTYWPAVSSIVDDVGHRVVVARVENDRTAITRCKTSGASCRERMLDAQHITKTLGTTFDPQSRTLYVATAALEGAYAGGPLGLVIFGI